MVLSVGVALAAIGAGIAVGAAGLGSGMGVGITGSAAAGAIAEKPEKFGKAIIFTAIPQTQGFYGFLTAILIFLGANILGGGQADLSVAQGLAALGAGIAVGIAGFSAVGQGITAAAGIGAVSEKDEMFGKSVVFSVLPETQAIYGLLAAVLIIVFAGIFPFEAGKLAGDEQGMALVGAGMAVGIAGLSAIGQGITAAGGIGAVSRRPETFGKCIIFAVFSETFAILGLLVALLTMYGIGLV